MSKRIGLLGSTGSIGTQTLDVIRRFPGEFEVAALSTHESIDELKDQAEEFNPDTLAVSSKLDCPADWLRGESSLEEIAEMDLDLLIVSVVGTIGLKPTITALRRGTDVGLATKEAMVAGGEIVNEARRNGGHLLPLDSEHHALYQLLRGEEPDDVKRLILTASGGPFRTRDDDLSDVTPEEALDHPNWNMGPKITIDSATMMNKGLELIEARYLFEFDPERVRALIHPQSIVHALVEYCDHSVQAHLSVPDMRLTLQSALFHPDRREPVVDALSLEEAMRLDFEPVDPDRYPCFRLAREAMERGGGAPTVLNTANESAVEAFLEEHLAFTEIPDVVEACLEELAGEPADSYQNIRDLETRTQQLARAVMTKN